jgi:hypothetical protein
LKESPWKIRGFLSFPKGKVHLIPSCLQDEINSLVICASGFVAHSLQIAADMRLARVRTDKNCPPSRAASPEAQIPPRLNLILKATWDKNKRPDHSDEKRPQMLADRFVQSGKSVVEMFWLRLCCSGL